MKNKKQIKPLKYYTAYDIKQTSETDYTITLKYFIYKGDVLSDSKSIQTKVIKCPAYKLSRKRKSIDNNIDRTESAFRAEFQRMGASKKAIEFIAKSRSI